jgi:hypothetical protein
VQHSHELFYVPFALAYNKNYYQSISRVDIGEDIANNSINCEA